MEKIDMFIIIWFRMIFVILVFLLGEEIDYYFNFIVFFIREKGYLLFIIYVFFYLYDEDVYFFVEVVGKDGLYIFWLVV